MCIFIHQEVTSLLLTWSASRKDVIRKADIFVWGPRRWIDAFLAHNDKGSVTLDMGYQPQEAGAGAMRGLPFLTAMPSVHLELPIGAERTILSILFLLIRQITLSRQHSYFYHIRVSATTSSLIQNRHLSISSIVIFSITDPVTMSLPRDRTIRLRVVPVDAAKPFQIGLLISKEEGFPVAAKEVQKAIA
ncbi:hypothetical protein H2248_010523 [Termitomyces sp. 'cryptogamus']|nr:hypothetical protein H2248_010523 [Termitomyces sp. 'cryptogamus']